MQVFPNLAQESVKALIDENVPVYCGDVAPLSLLYIPCGWVVAMRAGDADVFGVSSSLLPKSSSTAGQQKATFEFLQENLGDQSGAMRVFYTAVVKMLGAGMPASVEGGPHAAAAAALPSAGSQEGGDAAGAAEEGS